MWKERTHKNQKVDFINNWDMHKREGRVHKQRSLIEVQDEYRKLGAYRK